MTATTSCLNGFNPRAHAGRDSADITMISVKISFNPRAHAGRDIEALPEGDAGVLVSIHAPTRGATV